mmetsp:Transcript_33826/g.95177  ORF Transcript_33826/g.95177 Transcript_33826/m.95177 type:complete len:334 (+) Transcript_33826:2849-3850(+)
MDPYCTEFRISGAGRFCTTDWDDSWFGFPSPAPFASPSTLDTTRVPAGSVATGVFPPSLLAPAGTGAGAGSLVTCVDAGPFPSSFAPIAGGGRSSPASGDMLSPSFASPPRCFSRRHFGTYLAGLALPPLASGASDELSAPFSPPTSVFGTAAELSEDFGGGASSVNAAAALLAEAVLPDSAGVSLPSRRALVSSCPSSPAGCCSGVLPPSPRSDSSATSPSPARLIGSIWAGGFVPPTIVDMGTATLTTGDPTWGTWEPVGGRIGEPTFPAGATFGLASGAGAVPPATFAEGAASVAGGSGFSASLDLRGGDWFTVCCVLGLKMASFFFSRG